MAYPSPPDFQSGEPLAAWFLIGLGEGRTLGVATQGETANKRIQRALNQYFVGRVPQVVADGVIGDRTLAALETAAREHQAADPGGGYGQIREVIAGDRRARRISPLTYRWGLWLAYVRGDATMRGRTYGDVVVAANARYPAFGQAPDDDRDAGGADLRAITWVVNSQPAPVPPARSETRTPIGSPAPAAPAAPSSELAPVAPATLSTRATGVFETEYGGVKGKWWAAAALAAAGVGYVALTDKRGGGGGGGRRRARRSGVAMPSSARARARGPLPIRARRSRR